MSIWSIVSLYYFYLIVNKMSEVFQYQLGQQNQNQLLSLLSPDELQQMQRYRKPKDQLRFLYARANLRQLLAHKLGCQIADIDFNVGEHGKLLLSENINFNLAHSGDWVLIILDEQRQVGVDVEFVKRRLNFMELAARFFHPREFADLQALPEQLQRESFFFTWVCKEAVIKCDGRGLALGLENFAVNVDPRKAAALLEMPDGLCQLRDWYLRAWQCAPDYYCSEAAASEC
jgi:phosphopantetheinyl transferase